MMFRNNTATACLLATTSLFLLAHDVVMAQTVPSFTIPTNVNIRGKVVPGATPTISNGIFHGELSTTTMTNSIEVKYYAPNCQGVALTTGTALDLVVETTLIGPGQYQSTIVNNLASLRTFNTGTVGAPVFPFYTTTSPTSGASARYQYCIEFLLKNSANAVIDQERYGVTLDAFLDGDVTTFGTVITDIGTDPDDTTFRATVIVCNPSNGNLVTTNFFEGDAMTLCFTSTSFPEASITNLLELKMSYPTLVGTTEIFAKGGASNADLGAYGTTTPWLTCVSTTGGVPTCSYTVQLGGGANTNALSNLFTPSVDGAIRTVTVTGKLAMKVGNTRRNVRVLFQNDSFTRNAETTFKVTSDEAKADNTCKCSGLFSIICWFFKCLLGFLFK